MIDLENCQNCDKPVDPRTGIFAASRLSGIPRSAEDSPGTSGVAFRYVEVPRGQADVAFCSRTCFDAAQRGDDSAADAKSPITVVPRRHKACGGSMEIDCESFGALDFYNFPCPHCGAQLHQQLPGRLVEVRPIPRTDSDKPGAGEWHVRFHSNNWMATVSFDEQVGFFTASAHELHVVAAHWGHKSPTLEGAKALADADVPPHECKTCPPWEKRQTQGE